MSATTSAQVAAPCPVDHAPSRFVVRGGLVLFTVGSAYPALALDGCRPLHLRATGDDAPGQHSALTRRPPRRYGSSEMRPPDAGAPAGAAGFCIASSA